MDRDPLCLAVVRGIAFVINYSTGNRCATEIREIEVSWPNKTRTSQKWENLPINQIHVLQEE